MEYQVSDSSGTDGDVPPSHQGMVPEGGYVSGKGRSAVGSAPYFRMQSKMEAQIHQLEQEAHCAVLRAFKAQSDAISWEKEGLITELRKELQVSDDEHRELLRAGDWRQSGGNQAARLNATQPVHDLLPSPSVSASGNKQKTSQSVQSLPGLSSAKSMHYPSGVPAGNRHFSNRGSLSANEPADAATIHPLVGRKVWTRWPEDNNFCEAVITDYNHADVCKRFIKPLTILSLDFVEDIFHNLFFPLKFLGMLICTYCSTLSISDNENVSFFLGANHVRMLQYVLMLFLKYPGYQFVRPTSTINCLMLSILVFPFKNRASMLWSMI